MPEGNFRCDYCTTGKVNPPSLICTCGRPLRPDDSRGDITPQEMQKFLGKPNKLGAMNRFGREKL